MAGRKEELHLESGAAVVTGGGVYFDTEASKAAIAEDEKRRAAVAQAVAAHQEAVSNGTLQKKDTKPNLLGRIFFGK